VIVHSCPDAKHHIKKSLQKAKKDPDQSDECIFVLFLFFFCVFLLFLFLFLFCSLFSDIIFFFPFLLGFQGRVE